MAVLPPDPVFNLRNMDMGPVSNYKENVRMYVGELFFFFKCVFEFHRLFSSFDEAK